VKVGKEHKVLKLKKALYRLKQASSAWNTRIDVYFKEHEFVQCPYEHALYLKVTNIRVDNKSTIELAKKLVHHERSKHIDVCFHFIREHMKNCDVEMTYVASRDQVADIFTKPLPTELFNKFKKLLGMRARNN
jgi:Reverse transcriptase (RNA-dependent DNA polymerase)